MTGEELARLSVRIDAAGELWIPGADPRLEGLLDAAYARKYPGNLRWVPLPQWNELWADEVGDLFHPTRRVILWGKGPSVCGALKLPLYDGLHVAINEMALALPHADLVFAIDHRVGMRLRDTLPQSCAYVQPVAVRELPWLCPRPRILWRWAAAGDPPPACPRGWATVPCALNILGAWGFRQFLMIGCDSFDDTWCSANNAYPEQVLELGVRQRPHADYDRINSQIVQAIALHDLEVEWYHRI